MDKQRTPDGYSLDLRTGRSKPVYYSGAVKMVVEQRRQREAAELEAAKNEAARLESELLGELGLEKDELPTGDHISPSIVRIMLTSYRETDSERISIRRALRRRRLAEIELGALCYAIGRARRRKILAAVAKVRP